MFKEGELPRNDGGKWSREPGQLDTDPLLRDIAFNKHSRNFSPNGANIVSPLAKAENNVGTDGIQVRLIQGLPSELEVAKIIWKGKNATRGIDIGDDEAMLAEIGDDPESWREMFRGGLQTAMEAFVLVFEVTGVSRTCTHQLVRSRRAGFHQQSQRAGSYTQPSNIVAGLHVDEGTKFAERWPQAMGDGDGPNARTPESVWRAMGAEVQHSFGSKPKPRDMEDVPLPGDELPKAPSGRDGELAHAWQAALMWARRAYRLALESDVSYQDARYILPEGTENYIMCEYTLREFLNVYAYRACSMFSWEIVHVVRQMKEELMADSPWLLGTAGEPKISCELTDPAWVRQSGKDSAFFAESTPRVEVEHHCTFQGWEKVEAQCPFPWALEEARTFKPKQSI
jgi:thymidylate synthase ThyX